MPENILPSLVKCGIDESGLQSRSLVLRRLEFDKSEVIPFVEKTILVSFLSII
jgi:hypothetical protein